MNVIVGLLKRFPFIVLIAVVGIGGFIFRDHLTGAADDLRVGDCIDLPAQMTEIKEVQHRPCGDPHDAEVFAVLNHTAASDAAYPSQQAMASYVADECVKLWQPYRGVTYEADAELDFGMFYPTSAGWAAGDRGYTCHIMRIDGAKITGSLRAATP